MYALPKSNYLRRSMMVNDAQVKQLAKTNPAVHAARVKESLRDLGVSRLALWSTESRYLPHIVHPDESIGGVVYGLEGENSVMIAATDRRVIFLDKKPLFVSQDEITYDVVSGVSINHAGPSYIVTLHTRLKDYVVQTLNKKCATGFVQYIEERCLERKIEEETAQRHNLSAAHWAM